MALDLIESSNELREQLTTNSEHFRQAMTDAGFTLAGAGHPIIPVMLGDAEVASEMSDRLLDEGVYVIGFSFPVVPQGRRGSARRCRQRTRQRRHRHRGRRLRQSRDGNGRIVKARV